MSARKRLTEALKNPGLVGLDEEEAAELVNAFAHELVDRARRGVDIFEDHVGGFQYSRDVREILDVVDPTTPNPDGWDF